MHSKRKSKESGAFEAIFYKDDGVTEGSSSNVFIVKDNKLLTHPADNKILSGITRGLVLEMARENNIQYAEEVFTVNNLLMQMRFFLQEPLLR